MITLRGIVINNGEKWTSRRKTRLLVAVQRIQSDLCGLHTTVGSGLFVRFFVWVISGAAILKRIRGGVAVQMIQLA